MREQWYWTKQTRASLFTTINILGIKWHLWLVSTSSREGIWCLYQIEKSWERVYITISVTCLQSQEVGCRGNLQSRLRKVFMSGFTNSRSRHLSVSLWKMSTFTPKWSLLLRNTCSLIWSQLPFRWSRATTSSMFKKWHLMSGDHFTGTLRERTS